MAQCRAIDDTDTEPGSEMYLERLRESSEPPNVQDEVYVKPYTERYVERYLCDEDFEYNMHHKFRGYAIIINNQFFYPSMRLDDRPGSDYDRDALIKVCEKIGFDREDIIAQDNLTDHEMKGLVEKYAKSEDNRSADCFMLFILTHGGGGDIVYGTNAAVTLMDIMRPIKESASLTGKPKMIFIQASCGPNIDRGRYFLADDIQSSSKKMKKCKAASESDFFYGYSTVDGFCSFQNEAKGSWFIQALSEVFTLDGRRLELTNLMSRVTRMVSYQSESLKPNPEFSEKKQCPIYTSTLTKGVYF